MGLIKKLEDWGGKLSTKAILFGVAIGVVAGGYGFLRISKYGFFDRNIPTNEEVQTNFIAPGDIEKIFVKDLDGNGEEETYLQINGSDYALKWDKNNRPYIEVYSSKKIQQCLEQCIQE